MSDLENRTGSSLEVARQIEGPKTDELQALHRRMEKDKAPNAADITVNPANLLHGKLEGECTLIMKEGTTTFSILVATPDVIRATPQAPWMLDRSAIEKQFGKEVIGPDVNAWNVDLWKTAEQIRVELENRFVDKLFSYAQSRLEMQPVKTKAGFQLPIARTPAKREDIARHLKVVLATGQPDKQKRFVIVMKQNGGDPLGLSVLQTSGNLPPAAMNKLRQLLEHGRSVESHFQGTPEQAVYSGFPTFTKREFEQLINTL